MTVAELIEKLSKFDPALRVVTAGFDEAGVDDIETVEIRKINFDVHRNESHIGWHEIAKDGEPAVWIDW